MLKNPASFCIAALAACALAMPAWCGTTFQFSTGSPSGTITAIGSTLDSLSSINFNTVTITDSPLDPNGVLTYSIYASLTPTPTGSGALGMPLNGNELELIGSIGSPTSCTGTCGLPQDNLNLTGAILYEVALADTTTGLFSGNKGVNIGINSTATSISDAALAIAVGLTGATQTVNMGTSGIGGSGTGALSGGSYTFTAASESLNTIVTSTPEPASFFAAFGGLLFLAVFARVRRRASPAI